MESGTLEDHEYRKLLTLTKGQARNETINKLIKKYKDFKVFYQDMVKFVLSIM